MHILLLVITLLFPGPVEAQSQEPSPAPSKATQKPQAQSEHNKQRADADQRGTQDSPLFIKVIPSTSGEPQAAKETHKQDESTSPEWWLVYVTLALVTVTTGLAIYTAKLWGATKSLAEEAKRSAERQANEMQESLRIAKDSVEIARSEFLATHCPRLIVRRISIHVDLGAAHPLGVDYEIANIGGTRATLSKISAKLWLPEPAAQLPPIPPYGDTISPADRVIESGGSCLMKHQASDEEAAEFCLQLGYGAGRPELPVLFPGNAEMYFFGYIDYEDGLGRKFQTGFLRGYDFNTKRFSPLTKYPDYEYLA